MRIGVTRMKSMPISIAFAAALAAPTLPAVGAGPFDGNWYVDAPAADQAQPTAESSGCDAVRLPFKVVDNQITGSLQRDPYATGRVEAGYGSSASPITGTVAPDGTLSAQGQSYQATGKLTGDRAVVRWDGECGPRVATGGRAQ